MPNAVSRLTWETIAELVREHRDLAAMVGLMRKHVGKHRAASRPDLHVAVTGEFRDPAIRISGESVGEHAETLRRAFLMRGGSLLDRAAMRVEQGGAFQVRRGIPEPRDADVVEVRENRGDGATVAELRSWRMGAPSPRVEMREKELIHRLIDGKGFQQGVSNLGQDLV